MTSFKLPNFLIVGAAKSGTTSLYYYLDSHPEIYMSPIKETNFFSTDIDPSNFRGDYKKIEKSKGINLEKYVNGPMEEKIFGTYVKEYRHYLKLFKNAKNEKAIGEVSNSYMYSEVAAKNINDKIPDVKIIMILRSPVTRAFSQYLGDIRNGEVWRSFREELECDMRQIRKGWRISHLYLELGMYYQQVKRYLDLFPKNNIKIYLYEDFKENTEIVLNDIFSFLEVTTSINLDTSKRYNEAKIPINKYFHFLITRLGIKNAVPLQFRKKVKKFFFTTKNMPKLNITDREYLIDYYKEDIKKLSDLINRDLSSWFKFDKN